MLIHKKRDLVQYKTEIIPVSLILWRKQVLPPFKYYNQLTVIPPWINQETGQFIQREDQNKNFKFASFVLEDFNIFDIGGLKNCKKIIKYKSNGIPYSNNYISLL